MTAVPLSPQPVATVQIRSPSVRRGRRSLWTATPRSSAALCTSVVSPGGTWAPARRGSWVLYVPLGPSQSPLPRTRMLLPRSSLHHAFITKALYLPRRKYKIQVKTLSSCLPGSLLSAFPSVSSRYSPCLYVCVLYPKDVTWTHSSLTSCEHVAFAFPR